MKDLFIYGQYLWSVFIVNMIYRFLPIFDFRFYYVDAKLPSKHILDVK